jgi:hypothetical protein
MFAMFFKKKKIMEFKQYFWYNYFVSKCGVVKNNKGQILTPFKKNGYLCLELYLDKKKTCIKVHRIVAIVHKPNIIFPMLTVNHLDGNKLNNHIDNLEWCTASENTKHYHKELKKLKL